MRLTTYGRPPATLPGPLPLLRVTSPDCPTWPNPYHHSNVIITLSQSLCPSPALPLPLTLTCPCLHPPCSSNNNNNAMQSLCYCSCHSPHLPFPLPLSSPALAHTCLTVLMTTMALAHHPHTPSQYLQGSTHTHSHMSTYPVPVQVWVSTGTPRGIPMQFPSS